MAMRNCGECGKEVSTKAEQCPHCGAKRKKTSIGAVVLAVLVLILIIGSIVNREEQPAGTPGAVASPAPKPDPKVEALAGAEMKNLSWRKDGFGNVMVVEFDLRNKSKHHFKDFEVTCEASGASGTRIHRLTKVVYETVRAGKTRHVADLNMGLIHDQATRAGCYISDLALS